MKPVTSEYGLARKAHARLRMIQHSEQVTQNVRKTCRFFGVSRNQFYLWLRRYGTHGFAGLRDRPRRPRTRPHRTPPHIEALILRIRQERQYGVVRLSLFLRRYYRCGSLRPRSPASSRRTECAGCPSSAIAPGPAG